jgi:hypothetical protein
LEEEKLGITQNKGIIGNVLSTIGHGAVGAVGATALYGILRKLQGR